ncbi:hypothetical protein D3C74_294880 [compost metagenome]
MEANITMKLDKEDLSYELRELVEQLATDEIERMVKAEAEQMVKEEVRRIVAPIVDSYLDKAKVGSEIRSAHDRGPFRNEADVFIKRIIQAYLDEEVYLYAKDSEKLSEKYAISSGYGNKTRAELWVIEKARNYADTELLGKMNEHIDQTLKEIMPSKEQIQAMINEAVKNKFNS